MKGHWRRESAALQRGASRQSQVNHNSYANVAQQSSLPKHLTTLCTASLPVRKATEGPQSVGTNIGKRPAVASNPHAVTVTQPAIAI